ncbi:MAG: leucyl aminopeptidase family protein [Legionellales bacterium]|nr:leucyl aminopeptidase family protein [Legionellales bacterium]
MKPCFTQVRDRQPIDIHVLTKSNYAAWLAEQNEHDQNWLAATGFSVDNPKAALMPEETGKLLKVIYVVEHMDSLWQLAGLSAQLPPGVFELKGLTKKQYELAACAWGLAVYKFTRYKATKNTASAILFLPLELDVAAIDRELDATYLVRDLINTPAEHMGPADLALAADKISLQFGATIKHIKGDDLIKEGFPAIHAVGRGSKKAPQLIDMVWGNPEHPKITLVGKGVCFDSGGLDLKSASNMRLMKKDMGGAAHVLGLAYWIMSSQLPIRLRVIIGAAENMISGDAYRPGDVVSTRKGLTVEIGNTDAEGRVVLSDCLALACEDNPEVIIDFATLTGAGKVGLGPDVPSLFSNCDEFAKELERLSLHRDDPLWHMPLYKPYRDYIDSSIADLSNDSSSPFAGAITAALFLNEFVNPEITWAHLDIMAWNVKARPGRPEGGEAMGLRTAYEYILSMTII